MRITLSFINSIVDLKFNYMYIYNKYIGDINVSLLFIVRLPRQFWHAKSGFANKSQKVFHLKEKKNKSRKVFHLKVKRINFPSNLVEKKKIIFSLKAFFNCYFLKPYILKPLNQTDSYLVG
jgi:cell shape-determining protein MreC